MKSLLKLSLILTLPISIILISCQTQKETNGPYFGNGFHNGWADQNSIVIWTRLTKNSEGNSGGEKFLVPSAEEHRKLDREANPDSISNSQIPDGLALEQMIGACPGAAGEVKLSYFSLTDSENRTETDWVSVDQNKNFTTQWKLENLLLLSSNYLLISQTR